jgi:dTDP-4-dehydrorhamnose 3,5-epimerase-like enzyme
VTSNKPHIIDLPKVTDPRGNLSFIQNSDQIPFDIQRTYWIYDVPGGMFRNGHAFRTQHEFIVALSGSFDVVLHDGVEEKRIHLSRSYYGLYVPPMTWRSIDNFSTNSVAMVLSSTLYDENDYIRNFEEFQKLSCNEK